jgi:hypothetical protein
MPAVATSAGLPAALPEPAAPGDDGVQAPAGNALVSNEAKLDVLFKGCSPQTKAAILRALEIEPGQDITNDMEHRIAQSVFERRVIDDACSFLHSLLGPGPGPAPGS